MICWLDLETDGLSPTGGKILEVAVAFTDDDLREVDRFHTIVRPSPGAFRSETLEEAVYKMHTDSGLLHALEDGHGIAISTAEQLVVDALVRHGATVEEPMPWGGSGVERFDTRWLEELMPRVFPLLTYWAYDMGTIRRFCRLAGTDWELPDPKAHRAMADVERHIKEARHYRDLIAGRRVSS